MAYKPLCIAGFSLMAISAVIYGWSLHARDVGIRAIEQARRELSAVPARDAVKTSRPATPDTTTWSAQRVTAYHAALIENGAPLALLRIPSLNLVVPVFEGTSEWALNRGVGRIAGTAVSVSEGNMGIAGHRDGFFRPLKQIRVGDTLILEGTTTSARYRVTELKIVAPADIDVLQATPIPTLTLITCYPFYYIGPAPQRFIVHATRIDSSETADQTPDIEQRGQADEQHTEGGD